MTISNANLEFNREGTPIAREFDDVYFSNANGLEETQYVFIHNNHLIERWKNWQTSTFVIGETGFGTGLNFLATWQAFRQFRQDYPTAPLRQLIFVSTEKFPISHQNLTIALDKWPALSAFNQQLLDNYPPAVAGCHRMQFEQGQVTLDLWMGDVHTLLPQMHSGKNGCMDCWFLDGFAPSKNPDMWTTALFQQMARLSKPNATFATFTAAGLVKRGLAEVGFKVEKRKGFGRKRDMLAGTLSEPIEKRVIDKVHFRHPAQSLQQSADIAIVGAGLAGANLAYSLVKRGFNVKLYDRAPHPASGASGNPQGGFYPQLNAEFNAASQVQALAFQYALNRYRQLLSDGYDFAHDWCGVLQLSFNDTVLGRHQKLIDSALWPESLIQSLEAEGSSQLANLPLPYPSLYIKHGGWISPPQLVNALLSAAKQTGRCEVLTDCTLSGLQHDCSWQLHWQNGYSSTASMVVIATGAQSGQVAPLTELPFRLVRGQVESIPSQPPLNRLKTVLCHKGYLTPAFQQQHALGSTYVKNDMATQYRLEEQRLNLQMNQKALSQCDWATSLQTTGEGRAATRCSSPDHLPLCGAVPDYEAQRERFADLYKALPIEKYGFAIDQPNLFILSGLGSRGLTTAPLMAEILACQIADQPMPLPLPLLKALNPNRFLVRDLIRRSDSGHKARR